MAKAKGVISETEWESGVGVGGSVEKAGSVLEALKDAGKGGMSMEAIKRATGLRWPYSTVIALVKSGALEAKKIGKAKYFRLKPARKPR